ncbi:MAG: hypothetical protein E2P02_05320 [Acidobacteria bacterium]|nr:MAG: hypothetical protein E2P02_05320 [Acidobacteriota bacterium]
MGNELFHLLFFSKLAQEDAKGLGKGPNLVGRVDLHLASIDPGALFTAIEPVLRVSRIKNDFRAPPGFAAPSVVWDWTKIDVGVRIAILQNVDLFAEYAFHDIEASKQIGHDEFLMTLRWAFP